MKYLHVMRPEPGHKLLAIELHEGIVGIQLGTVHLKMDAPGDCVKQGVRNHGGTGKPVVGDKHKGKIRQLMTTVA